VISVKSEILLRLLNKNALNHNSLNHPCPSSRGKTEEDDVIIFITLVFIYQKIHYVAIKKGRSHAWLPLL
jgi:hypothetical protein